MSSHSKQCTLYHAYASYQAQALRSRACVSGNHVCLGGARPRVHGCAPTEVRSFHVVCPQEDEESRKSTTESSGSLSIESTWSSSSSESLQFFVSQLSHEASVQADPALSLKESSCVKSQPGTWTCADAVLQSTFDLSKPVREIDIFSSHSWLAVGWLKVVAVAYHTNIRRAVVLSLLDLILTLLPEFGSIHIPSLALNLESVGNCRRCCRASRFLSCYVSDRSSGLAPRGFWTRVAFIRRTSRRSRRASGSWAPSCTSPSRCWCCGRVPDKAVVRP